MSLDKQINTYTNTMYTIKIIQHNVAHWKPNRHNLTNIYKEIDPHIVLMNSHGLKEEPLNIYIYTTHKINTSNYLHDGSAILVKHQIK